MVMKQGEIVLVEEYATIHQEFAIAFLDSLEQDVSIKLP
jgi:hypothetical protein